MSDEDLDLENGPKALREAYEKQKADMAALQKELSEFRTERRTSSVASALKAKGLDEARAAKVAKFYRDEDTSEGAVSQWLEQNADVFGVEAPAATQTAQGTPDPNAQAAQRVLGSTSNQVTPVTNVDGRVLGSPDELEHQLRTLPYEDLVRLNLLPPAPKR